MACKNGVPVMGSEEKGRNAGSFLAWHGSSHRGTLMPTGLPCCLLLPLLCHLGGNNKWQLVTQISFPVW